MTIAKKLQTVAERQKKVYDAGVTEGKQAERDAFWDAYQSNGKADGYLYAFAGTQWTDDIYNPKYPIKPKWNIMGMYFYSQITDTKVDIDISNMSANCSRAFEYAQQMKTIRKFIVGNDSTVASWSSMFTDCQALENIVIEGTILGGNHNTLFDIHWSTKLSHDSIVSIINALSPNASGKTASFSATAVGNAFEGGSEGAEWKALIATKPNWTISLV